MTSRSLPIPPRTLAWSLALLAGAVGALACAPAHGDEGLYGPAAPPGSAFVRVFNGTPQSIEDVRVGTEDLNEVGAYEASEFTFLPPGSHALVAGTVKQSLSLKPDRYYTAAIVDGKVRLLDNERYANRMKALVIVYNLVDGADLSLRTADGRTAVVDKIAPNATGQREVNAVRTQLALYRGDQRVASVRPVALERGRAFSLFVTGSADQPMPVWVVN